MSTPMVLMFHIVLPTPAQAEIAERNLYVSPDLFAAQMEDLAARGFRSMRLAEFRAHRRGIDDASRRFLLTFDDAYAHVDEIVTPVLRKHSFTAVMFAPMQHLGERNVWDSAYPNLSGLDIASAAQLKRMAEHDWEVASHGLRHVDLTTLNDADVHAELVESRKLLSQLLGTTVVDFAYPCGGTSEGVRLAVRAAGYQTGFLANVSRSRDSLMISRRPIRGDEGMGLFRLKTSAFADTGFWLSRVAPGWAKGAARRAFA